MEETTRDHSTGEAELPVDDPYNKTIPPVLQTSSDRKRRSLDDMRRLSENIKAASTWVRPQKKNQKTATELARNFTSVRAVLERVLAGMERLRNRPVDRTDPRVVALMEQLQDSTRHLEEAVACLVVEDPLRRR